MRKERRCITRWESDEGRGPLVDSRFDQRVALVTGAGGDIGRAVSVALAHLGAMVACLGRQRAPLDEVATAIRTSGGQAAAFVADVRQDDECRDVVARVAREFGTIDILVNNAGITSEGSASEGTRSEFDNVMPRILPARFHSLVTPSSICAAGAWS